jgi:hypothetical protein
MRQNALRASAERLVTLRMRCSSGHDSRLGNSGAADWLIPSGPFAIACNHPIRDDATTALIVTVYSP